ncbi:hypothetical protein MVEN_02152000 [Mycena venus]|uniref:Uncharacterized protein n=1 Tax=Mycena venus TaxID=2733690 RepID=A0A8H6X9I3_9AGAR|nr:hypothetical protein MVEN_02152000 [Mycena venus]
MDAETHIEPQESTAQSDIDILRRTCNAAFVNNSARDINFKDCVTNVTFTAAPAVPSDFRRIPLGDIDLQHEIRLDFNSRIVHRHSRASVRRVHVARVEGRSVTAMVYQGNGADEEWRRDLEKHMPLRHPNIIQIYGTASSRSMKTTLYHDELIPFQYFLDIYRQSHFLTVYVYACSTADFKVKKSDPIWSFLTLVQAACDYIYSALKKYVDCDDCTFWIRRSTGRLCAELTIPINEVFLPKYLDEIPGLQGVHSLRTLNTEAMVIDTLTLKGYHDVCDMNLYHMQSIDILPSMIVNVGAVIFWPKDDVLEHWVEIASLADTEIDVENHLRIGPSSFAWPDSPAYWSLDSLGVNRLSTEEVTRLGFPTIQLKTVIEGYYWDDSVYAGLRQFHQAKGFEPDSQDVALHLRLPLYQLSNEIEVPFAHVTEEDSDEEEDWDEDVNTTDESEDRQSAAIKENGMLLEELVLHSYSEGHVPFFWPNEPVQEQEQHRGDPSQELLFLGQGTGAHRPSQQMTYYGVPNSGPEVTIDGSGNSRVYGGVGQFHQANVFNIGPQLWHPVDQLSHNANVPFAHVEEVAAGEFQSVDNTDQQFDDLWPSASVDRVPDIDCETIPAKRSFEKTAIVLHEYVRFQVLSLRRLMLEEKAQLIEMQRLGVFTKEEFITRLTQIEACYNEPAARPTPAKCPRLSN